MLTCILTMQNNELIEMSDFSFSLEKIIEPLVKVVTRFIENKSCKEKH